MRLAEGPEPKRFREHRLLQILVAVYGAVWLATAIEPVARREWFLENLLVFVVVVLLAGTYRRFRLSDGSYLMICAFMILHSVGAYYIYANVPLGFWLQDALGLARNPYDRLIHAAFGLVAAQPIYEVFRRSTDAGPVWRRAVPVSVVLSLSALYEILEAIVAEIVRPDLGAAYLGSQGDRWDAQQDMLCGLVGGVLWVAIAATVRVAGRISRAPQPEEAP